jgi:hypothetical protein
MSGDYQKFGGIKPPAFAFPVDARTLKNAKPEDTFETSKFGDILYNQLQDHDDDDFQQSFSKAQEQVEDEVSKKELQNQENRQAKVRTSRDLSKIGSALKFLDREQKIEMERTDTRFNRERINEDEYESKQALLDRIPRKLITEKDEDYIRDLQEAALREKESEAKENTYFHNANMYQKLSDRNPIKEGSHEAHEVYDTDTQYKIFNERFITGLNELNKVEENLWQKSNQTLEKLTTSNPKYNLLVDDPYYSNDVDEFGMYLDYDILTSSQDVFQPLNEEEKFHVLLNAYEDSMRWNSLAVDIFGEGGLAMDELTEETREITLEEITKDYKTTKLKAEKADRLRRQNNRVANDPRLRNNAFVDNSDGLLNTDEEIDALTIDDIELTEDEEAFLLEQFETESARRAEERRQILSNKAVENTDVYFHETAANTGAAEDVLPVAAISAALEELMDQTDWSDHHIHSKTQFIDSYLDHFEKTYKNIYEDDGKLKMADIMRGSEREAKATYTELIAQGFIDPNGYVSQEFLMDPEAYVVNINDDPDYNVEIHNALRRAGEGKNSLDNNDHMVINGRHCRDIRVFGPDSDTGGHTIQELVSQIGNGVTNEAKLKSTRETYERALELYATMTGANTSQGGTGSVVTMPVGDSEMVDVKASSNASWQEWNPNHHQEEDADGNLFWVGAYETVENQELVMRFENAEEAQMYADNLKRLSQFLAPVLGMYDRTGLQVLNNNVGTSKATTLVTEGSEYYREKLITIQDYSGDVYEDARKNLKEDAAFVIGKEIFEKGNVSRLLRRENKKKWDKYNKDQKEHQESEFYRLRTHYKREAREKKQQRQLQKRIRTEQLRFLKEQRRKDRDNRRSQNKRKGKA